MNFFVAVTDYDWFQLHASKPRIDEVNFWRPSPEASFKALSSNEVLLFKLHSPRNFIVGGGFFTRFLHLPISLAKHSAKVMEYDRSRRCVPGSASIGAR